MKLITSSGWLNTPIATYVFYLVLKIGRSLDLYVADMGLRSMRLPATNPKRAAVRSREIRRVVPTGRDTAWRSAKLKAENSFVMGRVGLPGFV